MFGHFALKRPEEKGELWEIPGGRMEFGETLEQTLIREVKEETGLRVVPERIINSWDLIQDTRQISGVIYLCREFSGEVVISDEHCELQWMSLSYLHKLYPVFATRIMDFDFSAI